MTEVFVGTTLYGSLKRDQDAMELCAKLAAEHPNKHVWARDPDDKDKQRDEDER